MKDKDLLDPDIWGPTPTDEEFGMALQSSEELAKKHLQEAIALSDESSVFTRKLGIPEDYLHRMVERRQVAAVLDGEKMYIPAWQEDSGQLLPGIKRILAVFPASSIAFARWGVKPSADLDGKSPADCLREDPKMLNRVVAVAASLTGY